MNHYLCVQWFTNEHWCCHESSPVYSVVYKWTVMLSWISPCLFNGLQMSSVMVCHESPHVCSVGYRSAVMLSWITTCSFSGLQMSVNAMSWITTCVLSGLQISSDAVPWITICLFSGLQMSVNAMSWITTCLFSGLRMSRWCCVMNHHLFIQWFTEAADTHCCSFLLYNCGQWCCVAHFCLVLAVSDQRRWVLLETDPNRSCVGDKAASYLAR